MDSIKIITGNHINVLKILNEAGGGSRKKWPYHLLVMSSFLPNDHGNFDDSLHSRPNFEEKKGSAQRPQKSPDVSALINLNF